MSASHALERLPGQPMKRVLRTTKRSPLLLASALSLGLGLSPATAMPSLAATPDSSQSVAASAKATARTQAVVTAATAFLTTLSPEQRQQLQFPFAAQKNGTLARFHSKTPGMGPPDGFIGEQYGQAVWSNYPVSDVPRPGAQLGSLSKVQRAAFMHLLQTVLSARGYQKVLDIMGSDQALSVGETHFAAGTEVYTLGIFGTPSVDTPWMLEFGGHHLALNIVIAGAHGVMTPTLTGAQPSVYRAHGKTVRVLAGENDKAFALLNALDAKQRKQAILNYRVDDLVLGPGHDDQNIVPEGLPGSALNARQQAMLLAVIAEWAGIVNDAYAAPRLAEIKADLNHTWFAWSGPTTHQPGKNGSAYYRIQGPRVIIEFSPQGVGGDPTMHVHTIYRDPTNEYGNKLTAP